MSEAAEVGLLEGDKNLNMVKQYARGFGLDPDWVFNHTSFYTLTKILETDKREAEFNDRYQQMDKLLNQG